jgi:hypothetical protein
LPDSIGWGELMVPSNVSRNARGALAGFFHSLSS